MGLYGDYLEEVYLDESLAQDIKQSAVNIVALKNEWKQKADKFVKHKWLYRYISESDKIKMQALYDNLCSDDISYSEYKKSFNKLCQFMGLPNDSVIIENIVFSKDKKDKYQDIINVKYSKGLLKVKIPKSLLLIHVSLVDNLTQLTPTFRSKTKGKYLYPTKRVFFTVIKPISSFKGGNEKTKTYKYTTKEEYTTAYIDPTYSDLKDGAVYIETNSPIPVIKLKTKLTNLFNLRKDGMK